MKVERVEPGMIVLCTAPAICESLGIVEDLLVVFVHDHVCMLARGVGRHALLVEGEYVRRHQALGVQRTVQLQHLLELFVEHRCVLGVKDRRALRVPQREQAPREARPLPLPGTYIGKLGDAVLLQLTALVEELAPCRGRLQLGLLEMLLVEHKRVEIRCNRAGRLVCRPAATSRARSPRTWRP